MMEVTQTMARIGRGGKKLLVSLQSAGQTGGGQVQSFIERKSFQLETL